jgi:hypothetical protein
MTTDTFWQLIERTRSADGQKAQVDALPPRALLPLPARGRRLRLDPTGSSRTAPTGGTSGVRRTSSVMAAGTTASSTSATGSSPGGGRSTSARWPIPSVWRTSTSMSPRASPSSRQSATSPRGSTGRRQEGACRRFRATGRSRNRLRVERWEPGTWGACCRGCGQGTERSRIEPRPATDPRGDGLWTRRSSP